MEMDSSDSSSMSDEKSEESNKEVSEETNKTSDSGKKSDEDNSDAENEASSDSDSTSDEKSTETDIASEPEKMSREGGFGMGKVTNSMQASTVIEWEDRKRDLNNDDAADYWYASIPESKMSTIIGYKKVMEHCKNAFTTNSDYMEAAYKYLNVFEKESMKSVNYMLKEFEMKKSADAYTRSSIAKTGVLDMVKMHSYKYNEDLFRKITITPGEKNHGLVMLIDWSGSMSGQIHNAFKQLMQLVWICRRAGVKFEVFAFSDSAHGIVEEYWDWEHRYDYEKSNTFKFKLGDMAMSEHKLINLFSDRMSKMETKKMAHYLTIMTIAMGSHSYRTTEHPFQEYYTGTENIWWDTPRIPEGMNLGGTPLNSAVVNLTTFIPKYRKSNNIQKLNIVVITDGCSNNDCGRLEVDAKGTSWHTTHIPYRGNNVVFITDPVTKKDFRVNRSGRDTAASVSYTHLRAHET